MFFSVVIFVIAFALKPEGQIFRHSYSYPWLLPHGVKLRSLMRQTKASRLIRDRLWGQLLKIIKSRPGNIKQRLPNNGGLYHEQF